MRLQLLELSGFKSFPNRSQLSFESGVTAIVGPNGCGKSNLVDAITWVLGEQSAKSLRGERMDDVIFGGSDGRRPTSTAEVRLVLKDVTVAQPTNGSGSSEAHGNGNGDLGAATRGAGDVEADEEPVRRPVRCDVEVARRLYRSGESEYLIDGHVCRLRDVQDLLMSAGVGVKAYAVIEQGKIGRILSARPGDRRQLIEEAAGVTKFKSRRHVAGLKLEAARQNLSRVDDIIYELDKQRSALKRQSTRARRYQRLRDELRRWETVLIGRRHRALVAALDETLATLAAACTRAEAVAGEVAERDEALARQRAELTTREAGAAAARDDAHARELDVRRHQQQIAFDRQHIEGLRSTEAEIVDDLGSLEARRDPQQRALARQRQAAVEAAREREAAAGRRAEAEVAYQSFQQELDALEGAVEAARGEVYAAGNAATALRHAVDHAAAGHDRASEDLTKLDLEAADLQRELERATTQREEASRLLRDGRASLERTQNAIRQGQAMLSESRAEREHAAHALRQAEQELTATRARLRSLEELAAARAGYGDAARLVLSEERGRIDHRGSVADYLEVGREYERAVEGSLGDLLEHVIVPTHAEAEAGLRLVHEHGAGRCGFLVLDGAGQSRDSDGNSPPDGLTALESVVCFVGPHADAIRRAVGSVWIAPSFASAVAAARTTTTPVVTPGGDLLRGSHLVRTAGRGGAGGILATTGEIRELDERLEIHERRVAQALERMRDLERRIDERDVTVASLTAERHEQEKLIVGAELRRARADEEIERLTRKQALIETERRRADETRSALEARQIEARESITRLEAERQTADERLAAAQHRLGEARTASERLSRAVADAQAAHARLVERSATGSADVTRVERAVDELETRIGERADELQRTRDDLARLQDSIAESERRLEDDRYALEHLHEIVHDEDARVIGLHRQCDEIEEDLRAVRATLDAARAETSTLEVARATAESDIGHLAESCGHTLQMTLDEVEAAVDRLEQDGDVEPDAAVAREVDSADPNEATADVGDDAASDQGAVADAHLTAEEAVTALRAKIERLGPINMMAIEQFDELETRQTFLSEQRQDLVDSIAATGEAISRIERTTRARFKAAFETINRYFQETFATMFGGGRAGLTLLDEADLLESGLDIIAQPPGKRLQSVQLLSGGEKALTAIALMFAIFRYRPSPFCLLDEIDAPLDEANIGRFVQMLRGMLSHTQFILITHNRRTMEIADRLYGVTMEEPGVSKLVSVSLN